MAFCLRCEVKVFVYHLFWSLVVQLWEKEWSLTWYLGGYAYRPPTVYILMTFLSWERSVGTFYRVVALFFSFQNTYLGRISRILSLLPVSPATSPKVSFTRRGFWAFIWKKIEENSLSTWSVTAAFLMNNERLPPLPCAFPFSGTDYKGSL